MKDCATASARHSGAAHDVHGGCLRYCGPRRDPRRDGHLCRGPRGGGVDRRITGRRTHPPGCGGHGRSCVRMARHSSCPHRARAAPSASGPASLRARWCARGLRVVEPRRGPRCRPRRARRGHRARPRWRDPRHLKLTRLSVAGELGSRPGGSPALQAAFGEAEDNKKPSAGGREVTAPQTEWPRPADLDQLNAAAVIVGRELGRGPRPSALSYRQPATRRCYQASNGGTTRRSLTSSAHRVVRECRSMSWSCTHWLSSSESRVRSTMPELPTGTVTFLFTDLEGSTRLWEEHPEAMKSALAQHDSILRDAVEAHSGHVVKTTGDGVHAVFAEPLRAIGAAVAGQRALADASTEPPLRVRMGIHTGPAELRDGDYYGSAVNRAAQGDVGRARRADRGVARHGGAGARPPSGRQRGHGSRRAPPPRPLTA